MIPEVVWGQYIFIQLTSLYVVVEVIIIFLNYFYAAVLFDTEVWISSDVRALKRQYNNDGNVDSEKKKEKEKEKLLIFERSYVYAISFIIAWSVQIAVIIVFSLCYLLPPRGCTFMQIGWQLLSESANWMNSWNVNFR